MSAPIAKPAPPMKDRPACLYCTKPLKPDYNTVYAGSDVDVTYDHEDRTGERRRVWTGRWYGYPMIGSGEKTPTHCTSTCAIAHAARMCRQLKESGSISLTDSDHALYARGRPL